MFSISNVITLLCLHIRGLWITQLSNVDDLKKVEIFLIKS